MSMQSQPASAKSGRRSFFKGAFAVVITGIAALVPSLAAFFVLTDPLRRAGESISSVRVTSLEALPNDGVPRKFPVLAPRTDAWNKYADAPIGAVYLRRTGERSVEALNVVCPHAGCFVDFSGERGQFICPCHNSSFKVDGSRAALTSPAARGLDSLEVEVRADGSVWVRFENFEAGRAEKIPVA
ncbi:MAG TPA: Rieske 2Fe-2S domain-containing protein [Verrucomicrobiae bacterium]|jgi:Rieske Fe-S protein|nr:Rieske 2Fe-2S domain-containing protein [Verrucomicrobiae bacterium]